MATTSIRRQLLTNLLIAGADGREYMLQHRDGQWYERRLVGDGAGNRARGGVMAFAWSDSALPPRNSPQESPSRMIVPSSS